MKAALTKPTTQRPVRLAATAPQATTIWRPQDNISIWRRDLSPCLAETARQLAAKAAQGACFWVERDEDPGLAALNAFAVADWPKRPALALLAADIASMLGWFRRHSRAARLHVDLAPVRSNACRFYHTDKVNLRLLCSYAGPGTEWLMDDAVNRAGLGRGDNTAVLHGTAHAQHLKTGWAALLRGERDPTWLGRGIVHRSPPFQPGNERLLLTIDEPGPHLDG